MTFNERKIIKYLRDGEGRTHIQIIAQRTGVSSDYARLLCRSLERAGYLKFADANVCYLLTKGRGWLEDSGPVVETVESDTIVDPEIIVETEEKSEEEALEHVLAEIDGKKEEPELINEEDQKLDEIQNEILKEVEATNAEQPVAGQQEEDEEILNEAIESPQNVQEEIAEKIKEKEKKEGWLSKLRKSI